VVPAAQRLARCGTVNLHQLLLFLWLSRIFLVDVPGAQQAAVAMGEPGIQLMDRDEYSLQVGGDS